MASYTETRNGLVAELPAVAQLDSLLESVGVSNASRVVIYGDPLAAARLFFTFDYLGLGSRVSLLDGGLPAWIAANHPTATVTRAVQRGVLTPSPQPQLIVDVAEMVARLGDTTVLRLDARPAAEFAGAPSEGITRAGHIPGARNVFWRDALTGAGGQFLKPVPELRALLSAAGVAPGKEIVTYCKTGIQASYLYFVVRYLGYTPRLYDGSYAEWSSDPSRAVERD
jgi:thiosulfate/3-mercaptopyruvate sulfurtransferase